MSVVIDDDNNIHCVGWGSFNNEPYAVHFSYLYDDYWSDWTLISSPINFGSVGGADIDLFTNNKPAIAYRQKTYETGPYNDSTMYTWYNGNNWSEPELVVNDPYEQKIAIDPYNRVHIIDREKLETGTKLVHYQKYNDLWQGYIIDDALNVTGYPDITMANGQLYLVYNKSDIPEVTDIYITKYNIVTCINPDSNTPVIDYVKIYPNPFKIETTIEFELEKAKQINISIYNLNGKHIKTLKNEYTSEGEYRLIWNGKGKNGKEVNSGLYLIRLQSGRKIITKAVEYIK